MRRVAAILALVLMSIGGNGAVAQEATPAPEGCAVEPLPEEAVAALFERASTPAAAPTLVLVRLPEGEPVDEATVEELLATLNTAEACGEARDLRRFLALYSDDFILRRILAPEPEGVDPGAAPPVQPNAAGTPVPAPVNVIDAAVLLEDGSIAAHVFVPGSTDFGSIVWFIQDRDRWVIDDIQGAANPPEGRADIPAGAEGIVERVIEDAAAELEVAREDVSLASLTAVDWPNAALGCPEEGGVYAEVITPGYRIVVTDGESTLTYHTDLTGAFVNCSDG
jgi:hypothetical protein